MKRPRRAAPSPAPTGSAQLSLFDALAAIVSLGDPPTPAPARPPAPRTRAPREMLLDGTCMQYELRRTRRRTIGFIVGADGVRVSAPRWVSIADIEQALREKTAWILRALAEGRERARRLEEARVRWCEGAEIPFLGRSVRLVFDPQVTGVELRCDPAAADVAASLHLGLPRQADPEQIRDAVRGWLQRQAHRVFEERCAIYAPRLGVRMKRMKLSSAATRWGSASADGSIRLNWRLVHFAMPVIDYVVAHELAHLREMNHGAKFWSAVRSVLPDYESARAVLRDPVLPNLE